MLDIEIEHGQAGLHAHYQRETDERKHNWTRWTAGYGGIGLMDPTNVVIDQSLETSLFKLFTNDWNALY